MKKILLVVVLLVAFVATLSACVSAKAVDKPSTDNWKIDKQVKGNKFILTPVIDNWDDLLAFKGKLEKKFENIDLGDGAWIKELVIGLDPDPQVSLSFAVTAGAADQTFIITSPLNFAGSINPAQATASAGISATDLTGNGVTLTGEEAGGTCYEARYNGTSVFADLVKGPITAGAYATNTDSQNVGWTNIGNANKMAGEFAFTLSAGDSASGTSTYVILPVPEPSAFVTLLAGVPVLFAYSRRRRA